jgi:hypothetical protein
MKSVKKTWKFAFRDGALHWIKQLLCTEIVEGEEHTFISARSGRGPEAQAVRRAIRLAMKGHLARKGNIFGTGTGTYKEEVTIEFDPPGAETS